MLGAPVVESYGMTEASHQMASNPLPPGVRKPGSVGVQTGIDVAIMDDAGNLLPANERGEIVIRGASVIDAYERNPTANATSFTDGWFRTGDQGYKDDDGYLTISGRLKEIINKAGEKISPREIDELLLKHPAVRQAVTFALPHPTLGEDVGAAVVLRAGCGGDGGRAPRVAAGERLADRRPAARARRRGAPQGADWQAQAHRPRRAFRGRARRRGLRRAADRRRARARRRVGARARA